MMQRCQVAALRWWVHFIKAGSSNLEGQACPNHATEQHDTAEVSKPC